MSFFEIQKSIPGSLGRAGIIHTAHGDIKTPAFMAVGTNGYVRFIPAADLHELGAQAMLSNGYHLRNQAPAIAAAGGLANWTPAQENINQPQVAGKPDFASRVLESSHQKNIEQTRVVNKPGFMSCALEYSHQKNIDQPRVVDKPGATQDCSAPSPLCERIRSYDEVERHDPVTTGVVDAPRAKTMTEHCDFQTPWLAPTFTDSGGFQVMSLGSGLGKVVSMEKERHVTNTAHKDRLAKVTEDGVNFLDPFTSQPDFIGPEESMRIQCQIGADIHMAFDELTSLADTYEYNIEAMERTERWAERSLREHIKHRDDLGYRQNLYGVLQGGRWEDLRRSTAKTLSNMSIDSVEFDGFGLGGAFLKEDLSEILRWCNEELPSNKPRHLLGLSHPDDILIGTEMGADTFDCVAPTREARHGKIYTRDGTFNLRQFAASGATLDRDCDCSTCRAGWTRGGLRALWRSGNPAQKQKYCHLASIHNLRFIVRLTEEIRAAILDDYFHQYKSDFLRRYYASK